MNEEWRTIEGYEDVYEVSNLGRVRNVNTDKIKKSRLNKSTGYIKVDLHKNGKKKTFSVHRLVAFAFIENDDPENKTQVNHKDEDKTNNRVDNLEWCTAEYNINYGTHNERMVATKKSNPKIYTDEERQKISERMKGDKHWNYGNEWNEETKNKNMMSQKNRKQVRCVETGKVYNSIREAAREMNVSRTNLRDAITHRNRVQTCAGYHWEVIE